MHLRFVAALAVVLGVLALISSGRALAIGDILPNQQGKPDLDARAGSIAPSSAQQQIVSGLGAHATWNQFGTPESLIKYGGYLATGLSSDPVTAAKTFITTNEALFRLSAQGVSNLQLLNDSSMVGTDGHAVMFRQTFGGLPATQDGLITVGVVDGKVAYVSSSSAGDGNAPATPTLSAQQAWTLAAANVGHPLSLVNLSAGKDINGWRTFAADGLTGGFQRVRLTALPTPTQGVRPAYESIVLDNQANGHAEAYTVFVDAVTGKIWVRHNDVDQFANTGRSATTSATPVGTQTCESTGHLCSFDGTMPGETPADCSANGPFVAPANVKSVDVASTADVASNDIILFLDVGTLGNGAGGSSDEGTSPEAVHYEPGGTIPTGTVFWARTCPSPAPAGPFVSPLSYHGSLVFNDVSGTNTPPPNTPKWKAFTANPLLNQLPMFPWNDPSTDTRTVYCWLTSLPSSNPADSNCQYAASNIASRVPWDADPHTGVTTDTTSGNNATTGEAWASPLTAGGLHQQPQEPTRAYIEPWTNAWFAGTPPAATGTCNPANLTPHGNDILAAVTNLFVGHNRMHDFAYNLGFTETNFNAQLYNFGNTAPGPYPAGREGDPEEGDVEAGALTGGAPSYEGRDNANQITLNDGIPPITNQYLFQPIAGAFYSPCVDGDYDTSVFGHEYTHLISNRMVGGPDQSLSGAQAGAMGESWSDLDAMEYQFENGFDTGAGPYAIGPYVTGNPTVGIRDYAIDNNPLNYSDVSFDTPGLEVHADGEIWNGVNFAVRQALIDKWNATFPATNTTLQKACAAGKYAADACPGNRRWIQIVYDAFLLQQGSTSMLDARDAYLAADMMRFGGANQTALWHAFAKTGMGTGASTNGTGDDQPKPSFASPNESNTTITFNVTAPNQGNAAVPNANIYVGQYEARVTPYATSGSNGLSGAVKFVPGTYDFVAEAPGYGLFRFTRTFAAGQTSTVTVAMPTNWASSTEGATVAASTGTSSSQSNLIDDTEGTQWDDLETSPVGGQSVTVALGGGPHKISRVQVSAMIGPGQGRFSALRKFHVDACNASPANSNCTAGGFTTVYSSPADAFPGVAPRPVAPNLIMRSFTLSSPVTATHLRLVVDKNQCTGGPAYAGTQDNDPTNEPTDCVAAASALTGSGSTAADEVFTAEFEAFSSTKATVSSCSLGYPYSSSNPRTKVAFNESTVLKTFGVFGDPDDPTTQRLALFYNDEHAMTLGVNPGVTAMTLNPDHASNPSVGDTTAADPSGRPEFPAAFVTDTTTNPTSTAGDWQQFGTAISPVDIFGTWKAATKSGTSIKPNADPAKNNWNLGSGADPVPGTLPKNEGYGAEASWNFSGLGLLSGHSYRVEFMVHDGDQTSTGGDSGEACVNVTMP
jgi:hypothetical protein